MAKKGITAFFVALVCFANGQSTAVIDSLKQLYPQQKGSKQVFTLNELTYQYAFFEADSAEKYGQLAINKAKLTDDLLLLASAYNDFCFTFLYTGDFARALQLNKKALQLRLDNNGSDKELMSSYQKVALCELELGYRVQSFKHTLSALQFAKELRDTLSEIILLNNLGDLKKENLEYENALNFYEEGYKLSEAIADTAHMLKAKLNLAATYLKTKDFAKARIYLEETLKDSAYFDVPNIKGSAYQNLGFACMGLGDYECWKSSYQTALAVYLEIEDETGISMVSNNLGNYYLRVEKDIVKASYFYRKALAYAKKLENSALLTDAYLGMHNLYVSRSQVDSALWAFDLSDSISRQLYSEKMSLNLAEMQALYETAEKERELAESKASLVQEQLKVKQRTNWAILFGALVLLVAVIASSIYRQQKLKQDKLRKEAALKEELAKERIKTRLQEERVRISRDLHDHIGSQLTIISSRADELAFKETNIKQRETYEQISDRTRETMAQLRETIWAMNSEAVTSAMFVSKLREYTDKLPLQEQRVTVQNNTSVEITLGPAQAINLFRICQEALNNAIKHAGFSTMIITLDHTAEGLQLVISDDGKGFEIGDKLQHGYGLVNMKQRALDVGATFQVVSVPSNGTTITIKIDVNTLNYV